MKVLLTGANGFVGSRVLLRLCELSIPTVVLLRRNSRRHLIESLLSRVSLCEGSIEDRASLDAALPGVTHVVHCAGKTKALRVEEYEAVNVGGVRALMAALLRTGGQPPRLVHLSSLAASHPAVAAAPAREDDPPAPVSAYGRSKRAGEEVIRQAAVPSVILRPSAVYGAGDSDFLQLFKSLRWRVSPAFGGGRQPLSLVYVDDLARLTVECLDRPEATGGVFNVAHPEVITAAGLARAVAREMQIRPIPLPLPNGLLTVLGGVGDLWSRISGRPSILSRERTRELRAPGWVCDTSKLSDQLGLRCTTDLRQGLGKTLAWYREQGWL